MPVVLVWHIRRHYSRNKTAVLCAFELIVLAFMFIPAFAMLSQPVAAANHVVQVGEYFFDQKDIIINVGDTVTWHNGGTVGHTATSNNSQWTSISLPVGFTSDPLTFNTPGVYPYHCAIHPSLMWGSITVGAIPEFSSSLVVVGLMAMALGVMIVGRRKH